MSTLPAARMKRNRPCKTRALALSLSTIFAMAPILVPAFALGQSEVKKNSAPSENSTTVSEKTDKTTGSDGNTAQISNADKTVDNSSEKSGSGSASDVSGKVLKGSATKHVDRSPILDGVVQTIPPGVDVNLSLNCFLNSELSQVGDELFARVSIDVKDGSKVMLPEGWFIRGLVTDAAGKKRHSRDGYIEVTFDKLISPDGDIELQFPAKFSTKDNTLKSVAKVAMIDTAMVTKGALKGGLLGIKYGGIPAAIASYGIVPGSTAAAGAAWYGYKALRREGEIRGFSPGEVIKLKTVEPISLPGFNVKALPSYKKAPPLRGAVINVNKCWFLPDERDKKAQLLRVDFTFVNETKRTYSFRDFAVTTNLGQMYFPEFLSPANHLQFKKTIAPSTQQRGIVTFNVDKGKGEYYLILIDHNKTELSRALIK